MNNTTPVTSELPVDEQLELIARDIEMIQNGAVLHIGQRLTVARELFRYKRSEGGFEGWVTTRLSLSKSTAYNLIRVHERFGESVQDLHGLPREALYELARPSNPESVVIAVKEQVARGEPVSLDDIKQLKQKLSEKSAKIKDLNENKKSSEAYNDKLVSELRDKDYQLKNLNEEIRRLKEPNTITIEPMSEPESPPLVVTSIKATTHKSETVKTSIDEQVTAIITAWRAACPEAQQRAWEMIDTPALGDAA